MKRIDELYPPAYFLGHGYGIDTKRDAMYQQERRRIYSYKREGRILDVGCGVGAFLECFDDRWEKWGIEPARFAQEAARPRGVRIIEPEDLLTSGYFDVIIFRGTIQHIPRPFKYLEDARWWLKDDGVLVLLATPNTNSPYFWKRKTLPALDPPRNWLLPSDVMLLNALSNLGFRVDQVVYPYWRTPYARPIQDHLRFALTWLTNGHAGGKFPFWRSMMEIYAFKVG